MHITVRNTDPVIYLVFIAVAIMLLASCNLQPSDYTKVSEEEAVELIKNKQIDFIHLTYLDHRGQALSDSLKQLFNRGEQVRHFYKSPDGLIDQVRLVEATNENIFYELQVMELQQDPFSNIDYAVINCQQAEQLLQRAFERDQGVRQGVYDDIQLHDKLNRDTVISLLDQCDWPQTKDEVEAIWYVLQHSDTRKMAYFYPQLKSLVDQGLLKPNLMAKMEDRMLMFNGLPQIYGTQYSGGGTRSLHEVKDPEHLNDRRLSVGLEPITIEL